MLCDHARRQLVGCGRWTVRMLRRCVWKGTPPVEQLQMPTVPLIYYNTHVEPENNTAQPAPVSSKRARPMIDRSRERN